MDFVSLPEEDTSLKTQEFTSADIPSEDSNRLTGEEAAFAGGNPSLYAFVKTASDFVPFMWTLFPSGRKEFGERSTGGKIVSLGIDAAVVLPLPLLFKGAKSLMQSEKIGSWLVGKGSEGLKSLSALEEVIPAGSKFETRSMIEKVRSNWKLPEDEAKALLETEVKNRPVLWKQVEGPSGAFTLRKPSPNYSKLFKEGKLRKDVAEKINYWNTTPLIKQRKDFYQEKWKEKILDMSNGGTPNFQHMFDFQVGNILGEKAVGMSIDHASSKVMANLLADTIDSPRRILKQLDIGYHWLTPTSFLPSRKAMGGGERMFESLSVHSKVKSLFKDANESGMQSMISYTTLLAEKGFGALVKKKFGGEEVITGFKRSKEFTQELWEEYGKTAIELDKMGAVSEAERANFLRTKPEFVQRLINDVHRPFHNDLYKEFALTKIPQILSDEGLSEIGFREFAKIWEGEGGNGMARKISALLDPKVDPAGKDINSVIGGFLKELREGLNASWFSETNPKLLESKLAKIIDELKFSTEGKVGFPAYNENYTVRMSKINDSIINSRLNFMGERKQASFMHARVKEEGEDLISDPSKFLHARIMGQAKELWVRPYLDEQLRKIGKMPEGFKNYFDYWLGRMLGEPSSVDAKVAQWLTNSFGKLNRLFGKEEVWNARRVSELGYKLNDVVYLGALGFRPFSAVRNTFQPMLTVPVDMGGIKDIYWLARGYKRGLSPETQGYLQRIGAIGDYLEEYKPGSMLPKFGSSLGGREIPRLDSLRDTGMWLFKNSDRFTRYVAGGSALEKWDYFAKKFLTTKNFQPKIFSKKMNFHLRDDWVRRQLDEVMEKLPGVPHDQTAIDTIANIAKDKFVTDVVGDTQWLYGVADSPLIAGKYGVISKTGVIFQSWWMNYMTQMESWMLKRGTPLDRMDRFFTWIVSSAIAGELMVHAAGMKGSQARATVLGGPMPSEVGPMLIPPTWAPFANAMMGVLDIAKLDPEGAKEQFKRMGRATTIFIPGGIITGQAIRGYEQGGWEGLSRNILNYYGGTKEEFLR